MVKRKKAGWLLAASVTAFLLVLVVFCGWLAGFARDNRQRQKEALETALNRSILMSYTLEGRYPQTLEELLEKYPLGYDETLFYIDYRLQGDNILPEVTILEAP